MTSTSSDIRNVSDTALWVAMFRAQESERPDAHFRDPYAGRLAGPRGEAIARAMRGQAAWAIVGRTVMFDDFVMRLVRNEGVDTVLDLAAGLDARPWRLDLPARLSWFDVDLPEILEYKRRGLEGEVPRCRYASRPVDLRDAAARREVFAEIGAGSQKTLILSEGLLIYLDPAEVQALARDLAEREAFRWWAIDIAAPELMKRMVQRWGRRLARGNAPFRFAPAEGTRFFEPLGWREREFKSTWEEAARLKREMPLAGFWKLVARFSPPAQRARWRRFSGCVLLERG